MKLFQLKQLRNNLNGCVNMCSLRIGNFRSLYGIETRIKNALATLVNEFPITSPCAEISREIDYDTYSKCFKNSTRVEICGYFTVETEHEYHKLVSKLVKAFGTRLTKHITTSLFSYPAIILRTTEDFGTHKLSLYFKVRIENKKPETVLSKLFKCNIQKKEVQHNWTETVYACSTEKSE